MLPVPAQLEPGEHVLQAEELLVGYSDQPVCAPATFTLDPGEALALVGINGAGKSTLARTCCGLLKPLGGQVQLLGLPPRPSSGWLRAAVARDLGEEAFFPALSVREHLELVCLGHGLRNAGPIVDEALVELGLEALAEALPERLSSGQRRRLVLASVLVRPRSLLVLDEPEQRLDHSMRLALAERLVAECEAGGAVLLVSHDPMLVESVATSVLLVGEQTVPLSTAEGVRAVEEGRR
ncbi:Uncharacterized ABC transporter ATP-binding protein YbhF [Actinomyces bovis]|uniref:Uncharacterized ABC transporter ATP-binding protein YbhF n=1 Tax=Actinomyces bovis TaxID=1658 RepID=A0ABY1VKL0_9ACTO|nr:Uncharacterized ABC transporter ATP-binding protein YbhF [Actinomyces bovis]VEG54519.1 Uncharacterized ABC transporter ATP-binding protein YbhF [Actinomyces israelii]